MFTIKKGVPLMNNISDKIISVLKEKSNWMTSNEISNILNISTRTVKKYISEINDEAKELIESSRKGYKINQKQLEAFYLQTKGEYEIPQTPEERINHILIQLLFNKNSSTKINIYDLIDQLYISDSTFRLDCQKINAICQSFHCSLQLSKDTIWIEGQEKDKRKLLNSHIIQESQKHFGDDTFLNEMFPNLDFSFLKQIIRKTFEDFNYFSNDFSLNNFVRHVAIAIHRIQNGYYEIQNNYEIDKNCLEYQVAIQLTKRLEEHFNITFHETEIYELTLLITCRGNNLNTNNASNSEIVSFVGRDLIDFVATMTQNTKSIFGIDLDTPEFITRFSVHLHNLFIRNNNNLLNSNPLKNSIKSQCPFIYEIAVYMANQIKETYQIHLNDDEITYITFHIGGILEMQKLMQSKLKGVLLIPEYYNLKNSLNEKIQSQFKDDLVILDIFTSTQEYLSANISHDLLLSSFPVKLDTPIQTINITPFLTQVDIQKIRQCISNIKEKKKEKQRLKNITNIFKKEFFTNENLYTTSTEAIEDICQKLYSHGYVDENYVQEIKNREDLSSTAFGNFAIPHSLNMNCLDTTIYVHIQDKGILWGDQIINVIFLLSVSNQDKKEFRVIFEYITDVINDNEKFLKIKKSKNYEEFIHLFISENN